MNPSIARMIGKLKMAFSAGQYETESMWVDDLRKSGATVTWTDDLLPCYQLQRTYTITHGGNEVIFTLKH